MQRKKSAGCWSMNWWRRGMLRVACKAVWESGELTVKGSVEDEEETGRMKREASWDKNSPREPDINNSAVINTWSVSGTVKTPLLTVTNRVCVFHNCDCYFPVCLLLEFWSGAALKGFIKSESPFEGRFVTWYASIQSHRMWSCKKLDV